MVMIISSQVRIRENRDLFFYFIMYSSILCYVYIHFIFFFNDNWRGEKKKEVLNATLLQIIIIIQHANYYNS